MPSVRDLLIFNLIRFWMNSNTLKESEHSVKHAMLCVCDTMRCGFVLISTLDKNWTTQFYNEMFKRCKKPCILYMLTTNKTNACNVWEASLSRIYHTSRLHETLGTPKYEALYIISRTPEFSANFSRGSV